MQESLLISKELDKVIITHGSVILHQLADLQTSAYLLGKHVQTQNMLLLFVVGLHVLDLGLVVKKVARKYTVIEHKNKLRLRPATGCITSSDIMSDEEGRKRS